MSNSFRAGLGRVLIVGAAGAAALALSYALGRAHERQRCQAAHSKTQIQSQGQVIRQADADIRRSSRVGLAREADRAHIDAFFNRLAEESFDAPPDPVDRCVLPAERLRAWTDANAGPTDIGASSRQHDSAPAATASTPLGPGAGPGGQPPGGGSALPPTGQPALPPVGSLADPSPGMPDVHDDHGVRS